MIGTLSLPMIPHYQRFTNPEVELNLVGYTCDMVDTVVSVDNDTITKRRRGAYSESATLFFGTGEQGSDPRLQQSNPSTLLLNKISDLLQVRDCIWLTLIFGVLSCCQGVLYPLPDLHIVEQLKVKKR